MQSGLELRMYGFVPYNISDIQKGIQFGHAVVELVQKLKYDTKLNDELKIFNEWADKHKTFIILNGGTSNHSVNRYIQDYQFEFTGSMESHLKYLNELGVITGDFFEPDLNDMLSAIVFIVDERVFNKKDYPDFEDWLFDNYNHLVKADLNKYQLAQKIKESNASEDIKAYIKWVNLIGGEKNALLRDFLKNFRLA
jgi:hypothetical protein